MVVRHGRSGSSALASLPYLDSLSLFLFVQSLAIDKLWACSLPLKRRPVDFVFGQRCKRRLATLALRRDTPEMVCCVRKLRVQPNM